MKRLAPFVLIGLLSACEVTDLDNPETNNDITDPLNGPVVNFDIEATDANSFTTLLTADSAKTWSASAFTLAGMEGFLDCRLDDKMTLNADGTYNFDGGSDLCGAEDNQRFRTGTWELLFDEKSLLFDKGTSNEYLADVIGLRSGAIALTGGYFGMEIRGRYLNQ